MVPSATSKLLAIFEGKEQMPAQLALATTTSESLADLMQYGKELMAPSGTPINWAQVLALVIQLLPVVLPYLTGGGHIPPVIDEKK